MTRLERLQALERELADLSLRLTDLRIDEIRDALVDAAPDLIRVALAAQAYMSHHSLDNAEALEVALAPLLESEAE